MRWEIKIENKPNQRIVVKFDPINEELFFIGQFKPHNKEWVVFCETSKPLWTIYPDIVPGITTNVALISLEIIQDVLLNVYDIMKKRLEAYENIAEGMSAIKTIEIVEE